MSDEQDVPLINKLVSSVKACESVHRQSFRLSLVVIAPTDIGLLRDKWHIVPVALSATLLRVCRAEQSQRNRQKIGHASS